MAARVLDARPSSSSPPKHVAAVLQTLRSIIGPPVPRPPTSQQDLVGYAKRALSDLSFDYSDAEAINDMKLVGMKEMRAVTVFSAQRGVLKEKMEAELSAKRVPKDVIAAIVDNLAGVTKYTSSFEDFSVDSMGTGKIFKATVMLKPDPDEEDSSQVTMAVSGAQFDAATEVAEYEVEEVPEYKEVDDLRTVTETGLFGDYKVTKTVKKMVHMGTRTKRTPVFKQKLFTKAKLESIKRFLEGKTLGEVKMLYAPAQDGQ